MTSFNIEGEPFSALRKIAATRDITESEALRFCISLGLMAEQQRLRGVELVLRDARAGMESTVDMEPR